MCKNSFEGVVALKRAGLVSTFRRVYSALLKTSRVYSAKRRDQTGSFQTTTPSKEILLMVVPASLL